VQPEKNASPPGSGIIFYISTHYGFYAQTLSLYGSGLEMNDGKEERIAIAIGAIGTVGGIGSLIAIFAVAASTAFASFANAKPTAISIILLWGPGTASVLGGASSIATYFNWFRILRKRKKLSVKEESKNEMQSQLGDFIQSLPEIFKSIGCFPQIVTAALGASLIVSAATYTPLMKMIKPKAAEKAPVEKIMEAEEARYDLEMEPEKGAIAEISEKEGKFVIQVILMNTMPQANRVVKKLEMNGVEAYIAKVKDPAETKGIKYRVRVGDFSFISEAKAYASAKITPLGYRQWYIDNKSNDTIGKPIGYKPPKQPSPLPVMKQLEPPAQAASVPHIATLPADPYAIDQSQKPAMRPLAEPSATKLGGFWNARNTFRIAALGLSAASLGFGIYQNNQADSKSKYLKEYREAAPLARGDQYGEAYQKFHDQKNSIDDTKNLRNGFYIGAGTLGIAGVATFFF
jgi:hypothetical protein